VRIAAPLVIFSLGFSFCANAWTVPTLPRKAPEFTIVETDGMKDTKTTLLSSYRGKVVVLAFVHTTCPHCQAFSQELMKLHAELGPKGFQPIDVAWNDHAKLLVPGFVSSLRLDFPVGYVDGVGYMSEYEPVMHFMGFSIMDRPVVPLLVVIDKKGIIRAQSPPEGDPNLQDEAKLRELIVSLLNEGTATAVKTSAKKK